MIDRAQAAQEAPTMTWIWLDAHAVDLLALALAACALTTTRPKENR